MTPKTIADSEALEVARKVDDIYAQGHASVAQRTARVQIAVREAILRGMERVITGDSPKRERQLPEIGFTRTTASGDWAR